MTSETALSAEEAVARLRSLIENVVTTDEYRAAYRDALATLDAARSQPATEGLREAWDEAVAAVRAESADAAVRYGCTSQ